MAYRAYRPESANFRRIARPRSGLGTAEIERALNFDPWKSVYKQNFVNGRPESAKALNLTSKNESTISQRPEIEKATGRHSFAENLSRVGSREETKIFDKENMRPNFEMNKYETTKRVEHKGNRRSSGAMKMASQVQTTNIMASGPVISKVDPRSNTQIGSKPCTQDQLFKANPTKQVLSKQATAETNKNSLQNRKARPITAAPDINVIGQQEKWLDPADTLNPAPYTRLINFVKDNMLAANLKSLVLSSNEYYPSLTGKCMCGECECGQCKCVHFKYKPSNTDPNDNGLTTIYKEDFAPHPLESTKKRPVYNELHNCPTKVDYSSIYKKDYSGKSPFPFEETQGLNKAKEINIGVGDCNVKGPINKETKYRLDFPDWKCSKTEPIKPFMPQTVPKDLPFFAKPHNNEYGNFYEQGEVPGVERAPNKLHQKTS